jgi:hypothetical protein
MNPRLAKFLVRLYPYPWRMRYGAEFEAFLQSGKGGLRAIANVGWAAFCEHIVPTQKGPVDESAGSVQFRSLCIHAPWAIFGLGPVVLLAGGYLIALFMLWSGWRIFLPGADTPFGVPMNGFGNIYFQAARFLYFGSPVLVGWGIGIAAVRQRIKAIWVSVGLVLMALAAATNQVHASRTGVPRGLGHISLDIALGTSGANTSGRLFYALAILMLVVLPYLVWRRRAGSLFV